MVDEATQKAWLKKLNDELDTRQAPVQKLEEYHAGFPAVPEHVRLVVEEAEYRVLMRQSVTNWPELITDSVDERLEVTGFKFGAGDQLDKSAWELWQRNNLDSDAGLIHQAALVCGRAFVIVWAGKDGPSIVPEHASTTVVAYDVTTGERTAALRRWFQDGYCYATLYLPDALYKYRSKAKTESAPTSDQWEPREVEGEVWPLNNPLEVVPVVEFAVNRSLGGYTLGTRLDKPAAQSREFGSGAGEYERVLPVVDRINTTTFSLLLAQLYASFPVRALIGEPIKYEEVKDEDGEPTGEEKALPPFRIAVNRLVQLENPDAKLQQLPESDLENYIKSAEASIRHLAAITKTPPHYLLGEMVNLSADAIRAAEAGLVSKIYKHQRTLGESWEEVIRLALAVEGTAKLEDGQSAETLWKNPESRSMAERADAASKLKDLLPAEAVWEAVLQATPQQVAKWSSNGGPPAPAAPDEPPNPQLELEMRPTGAAEPPPTN